MYSLSATVTEQSPTLFGERRGEERRGEKWEEGREGKGERVKERKGGRLKGHSEALVSPAVLSHLCLMLFTLPLSSSRYVMAQQLWLNALSASGWALGFLRVCQSGPSGSTQKEHNGFFCDEVFTTENGPRKKGSATTTPTPLYSCQPSGNRDFIAVQAGWLWILSQH